MSRASLLVIRGFNQGTRFELDGTDVNVGRGVHNQLRILDTEISRNHAVISSSDGRFAITDRDSSNGTFVNGQAIETHRLRTGDQIQFGRTTLLFADATEERAPLAVDIVVQPGDAEASQIVGTVGQDAGLRLLERAGTGRGDQAAQSLANLRLLYGISEEMVSTAISIEELLQRILDKTLAAIGADRGCMLVADARTGQFEPRAVAYSGTKDVDQRMPVSRSIVDFVLKKGEGVRISDARADSRFAGGLSIVREGIREAMCVPMPGRYELMGTLYVDTTTHLEQLGDGTTPPSKFDDEQLRLLAAIGRQAALAVEDHRYQEAFVNAERLAAVGQTITILSHHIKNILQGVRGGSYLIDMGLQGHDENLIQEGWSVVEKNQDRIYHLVTDMLTFSKERQPKLEPADVNELVADIHELARGRAEELSVDLRLALADELPSAMFDQEGIHRAVLNVVLNALDAVDGQEQAAVEIRTGISGDGQEIWVEVADNGPGIPDDQLAAIFSIFESTKGSRGTGIGLAVSQKILQEHGGEILVESEPNRGSRFRLLWPTFEDEGRSAGRRTLAGD